MKRGRFAVLVMTAGLSLCLLPSSGFAEQPGLTLADCYTLALKQSEEIAVRQELIAEAEARFSRAFSGILPRVSFSSSDKRQDGTGGSAFTLKEIPERKIVMSQPLFAGFKEFAAMAGTQAEKRRREKEKQRAQQLLLADVSDAFYLFLEKQETEQAFEATRLTLVRRILELKERERLGRSRPSEVVTVEAQLYRTEANIEKARSEETTARQLLEFLTGAARIDQIVDTDPAVPSAEPEQSYLAKALQRPDVRALEETVEAAKQDVRITRAGYFPTVSMEGNYYLERVGNAKDVGWDATLQVDVPIFQGGQTSGAVKEAASVERQVRLRLSEGRRRAIQEIREAYANFQASVQRSQALLKATEATEESYRYQAEEYQLSLVSNLDVLEELEQLQESRRDYVRAKYETKRFYWLLKAAAGESLPAQEAAS